MGARLSEQEIQARLSRLYNYERLYPELKEKCERLKEENTALKARVATLEATIAAQAQQIEKLQGTIEEFKQIIFGRRKKARRDDRDDDRRPPTPPRTASSYRRPVPPDEEVTDIVEHPLPSCPGCGDALTHVRVAVRYTEDLLPLAEWWKALKRVTKHFITIGYCRRCRKRVAAVPLSKHFVTLGDHVKQFSSFATVIMRLSYTQVGDFLSGLAQFELSDGELAHLLAEQADTLRPEYERLKTRIDQQPGGHYDETSWKVQEGDLGNFAWVKTGTETPDTVFLIGQSRGKGNAEALKGPDDQIGITDDYGAYRTTFKRHQLCWAHPQRKLRDLAQADFLAEEQRTHCQAAYQAFAALYADVRALCVTPFDLTQRIRKRDALMERFDAVAAAHPGDPQKLATIKASLRKRKRHYFTCTTSPGIPPDNNKAERHLRHLVLKRKNSYGSKTQAGADTMSILYSVLLSLWWRSKTAFFEEFARLLNASVRVVP
jgi:transposase